MQADRLAWLVALLEFLGKTPNGAVNRPPTIYQIVTDVIKLALLIELIIRFGA